jgi:hypothetical protein
MAAKQQTREGLPSGGGRHQRPLLLGMAHDQSAERMLVNGTAQ